MTLTFKIPSRLLTQIRDDLHRPHSFAFERVGFLTAGVATTEGGLLACAKAYYPVDDANYIDDPSVGARMAPAALLNALNLALLGQQAVFHVHTHGLSGVPAFSGVDRRENAKFVPDFFKVTPQRVHGAIVLSDDAAAGQYWTGRGGCAQPIDRFVEIGPRWHAWEAHHGAL